MCNFNGFVSLKKNIYIYYIADAFLVDFCVQSYRDVSSYVWVQHPPELLPLCLALQEEGCLKHTVPPDSDHISATSRTLPAANGVGGELGALQEVHGQEL